MDLSLQATIADVAVNAALIGAATYAFVGVKRAMARVAPPHESLALGLLFGLTASAGLLVPLAALPDSLANIAPIAVALAAPFGGPIAGIIAAALAAAFRLWLGGAAALAGVCEIVAAGLIGLLATGMLRRGGAARLRWHVLVLVLTLPAAAFAGLALRWPAVAHDPGSILGLALFIALGTLLWGALLLYHLATEERLAEGDRRFAALAGNVPGVIFQGAVKPSGEIAFPYLSRECSELFGIAPEEAKRHPERILRMIHPEDDEVFRRSLREAGIELKPWSHDFRIVDRSGGVRWLRGHATPRPAPGGDIAWHGALIEVTRRKEREEALRRIERLHRLVAENTTDVIQLTAADGIRSYVSPAMRGLLGYETRELIGRPADEVVHPADIERVKAARQLLAAGGKPVATAYRLRRKDGSYVAVTETSRLADAAEATGARDMVGVIRPSEPPEARDAADAPFAKALEAMAAGVFVTNPGERDNPIIFANAAAAAITGHSIAQLLGRNPRVLQGPDTDPDTVATIREALAAERPISTTLLNYRRDGTPFWSSLHVSPIHSASRRLQAHVGVFFDLGDHRNAASDHRLARGMAERMAAEFISNINHELRTPLNGVIGFTDLLLEGELPPEQRRYATFVRNAGRSLLAVINNSLALSNIDAGPEGGQAEFSIAKLALSCNSVVWYAAREKGLDLNFAMKPDVIDAARGYPDRIRQVLLGLLGNAIKATDKGSVSLAVAKAGEAPGGTLVKFSVTDTGTGAAAEKQRGMVERVESNGTARGVAVCRALVEGMGGRIAVTHLPGGGECWFTVPLKLAEPSVAATAPPRKKGRILLAEDAPINQELMVALLTKAGWEVEVVGDGLAAVEAVKKRAFDVLLLDIRMPRLDGIGAAEAIRALPGPMGQVPIIAITAKALAKDVERCRAAGMNDHLAKPIEAASLLALIERWTAGRGRGPRQAPTTRAPASAEAAAGGSRPAAAPLS